MLIMWRNLRPSSRFTINTKRNWSNCINHLSKTRILTSKISWSKRPAFSTRWSLIRRRNCYSWKTQWRECLRLNNQFRAKQKSRSQIGTMAQLKQFWIQTIRVRTNLKNNRGISNYDRNWLKQSKPIRIINLKPLKMNSLRLLLMSGSSMIKFQSSKNSPMEWRII